jgi:DNA-binding GntR family transcriptional regulator
MEWSVGGQISTFDQLQQRYPVLTNIYRTRQALAPLIHEGVLESRHGSGTWLLRLPRVLPATGSLAADVAQMLTDLDALRDRMVDLHGRLADRSTSQIAKTSPGQR